uniref:Uncharacterized protein n=1 Tax=Megaselia scalaris TaxID=36166 RepID=T1GE21_MEGSC
MNLPLPFLSHMFYWVHSSGTRRLRPLSPTDFNVISGILVNLVNYLLPVDSVPLSCFLDKNYTDGRFIDSANLLCIRVPRLDLSGVGSMVDMWWKLQTSLFLKLIPCYTISSQFSTFTRWQLIGFDQAKERFFMKVLENGFDYIWQQFTYYDINFKIQRTIRKNYIVLGFKYYETAWFIFLIGIFLSAFMFAIELKF